MIHAFGKSSMIALRSRHARHVEISGRDSWVFPDRVVMEHSGDVTRLGSRVGAAPDARPIGSGDERSRWRGMVGEPHRGSRRAPNVAAFRAVPPRRYCLGSETWKTTPLQSRAHHSLVVAKRLRWRSGMRAFTVQTPRSVVRCKVPARIISRHQAGSPLRTALPETGSRSASRARRCPENKREFRSPPRPPRPEALSGNGRRRR